MKSRIQERRSRRSSNRAVALNYQLEYARIKGRLEAFVLSDDAGLVVAYAGDRAVCEELGAMAPLMRRSPFAMPMPPLLLGADVAVRPITILGQPLFLSAAGGGVARDLVLADSARGVERILSTN
ncbi:MAG: hypothetical protein IPK60_19000 [Sandaracinaceae bacterium]|jgi:hypothetical protein|nr:hypothetical protein [Sandaracinaceae bacterium]